MRNRLLMAFLTLLCGAAIGAYAQPEVKVLSDVTSKLVNADFTADEPVTETVCTYDYDMANNNSSLFGQQAVTGWTASSPSDNTLQADRTDGANAKAAGIFALVDPDTDEGPGLGSSAYKAPYANAEATLAGVTGPVLGMVAVWGGDFRYTQEVTLPAGDYMMLVTYYNVGVGTAITTNNNGFTATDGTAYLSKRTEFPINEWAQDTVIFRLTAETAGQISLGLKGDGGSGGAAHLFFDNVKLYQIESNYIDQVAIEEAKAELLALIETGEIYGVDVSASRAVYNNPTATLEEVLAAIENQKALNAAGVTDLSEYFIQNPKFADGTPVEGGICTYDYDCEKNGIATTNYSLLPVPGWNPNNRTNGRAGGVYAVGSSAFLGGTAFLPPTAMSDGRTEGNLLGVVTCWSATAQYTQNVTLPAGKYTVSISYYNAGGANAVAKNLNGFVASDGTEYLGEISQYTVGSWLKENIEFELEEETTGYFSLGYTATNTGSGNMPHLFVDGFSLIYVGTGLNASMFALKSAVNGANKLLDNELFNADLRSQLEAAVAAAQALIDGNSTDDEANKAATAAINALLSEVNASIEAYKDLNAFSEDIAAAMEKYNDTTYPALYDALDELKRNVDEAYDNANWTTAQIAEAIASLPAIIKEGVQKVWDAAVASGEKQAEDIDISVLFDQLAYTYSTTAVSNTNVPDKEWKYGSATNFKTQYGTAEVWNQSPFAVSRTIAGLPAGKYTITTKAFFRNADNATNYADYDPMNTSEAYVFAGAVKTGLTNVAAIASEDLASLPGAATVDDVNYVPNTQQGAYELFNNEAYTDVLQKSASTVLVSEGDLTFGVGADEMQANSWVVWYSFSITYNAADDASLRDVLDALSQQAENLKAEDDVVIVAEADAKLNDATAAYDDLASDASVEEMSALVVQFEEAIAYAQQSQTLVAELTNTYALYSEYLVLTVESDEPTFTELMGEIDAAMSDGFEDNEQIQGFIDGLKSGWAAYVQYPVLETASVEEPGDITPAIFNADFSDPTDASVTSADGWTREFTGGKEDKSNGVWEFYDNENFQISQTLTGLAEGFYRLRVQSFYRSASKPQDVADSLAIDPEFGKCAYLFGKTESSDYSTVLKNIFQREDEDGKLSTEALGTDGETSANYGETEAFYVPSSRAGFSAYAEAGLYWNQVDIHVLAGESLTLGLRKPEGHVTGDWCPFDNFQLYYLGTVAPDGVESIQGDTDANAPVAIYNLAGQRVNKAVKGLYIINGKKVLVK